jgi:hypothetical protein
MVKKMDMANYSYQMEYNQKYFIKKGIFYRGIIDWLGRKKMAKWR